MRGEVTTLALDLPSMSAEAFKHIWPHVSAFIGGINADAWPFANLIALPETLLLAHVSVEPVWHLESGKPEIHHKWRLLFRHTRTQGFCADGEPHYVGWNRLPVFSTNVCPEPPIYESVSARNFSAGFASDVFALPLVAVEEG